MKTPSSQTDSFQQRVYPPIHGLGYLQCLQNMHKLIKPEWYLEVGCLTGRSLRRVTAKTIAVDPFLQIETNAFVGKKELHLFQMPSDEFFEMEYTKKLTQKIDFAFLDGMHWFEYLLRDFINTEKLCDGNGVICMHDCVPMSLAAADRTRGLADDKAWTGDVWKVLPILKKYRPDLSVRVLDCPPSGLTVVSALDPLNSTLIENYDDIVAEFMDETVISYGSERLYDLLNIESSRSDAVMESIANPER